ncbi:MAG: hypothetical protein ACR2N3_17815 [Pyrinomonadaceae bacterium]
MISDSIQQALSQGYNPDEVLDEISKQNPNILSSIQAAKTQGHQSQDILQEIVKQNQSAQPEQTQQNQSSQPQQKSVGGFLGNIASSAENAVGGIVHSVAHPLDTLNNISNIGQGALEKITGVSSGNPNASKTLNNVAQYYGQRIAHPVDTLYNDPVGAALDVSSILDPAARAITGIGDASKIGAISRAGEAVSKAGELANPINAVGKGISYAAEGAGKLASEALGTATGAGAGAIREAFTNPSEGFTNALRGNTSAQDIFTTAKDALNTVKDNRAAAYQSSLAKISGDIKLDLTPVVSKLSDNLKKFGINFDASGGLDFSRSTLSNADDIQTVKQAFQDVKDWGSKEGDLTPVGIDTLKRRLDNLYSANKDSRAFTTSLRSSVNDVLQNQVPGYADMTKGYSQASSFIQDVTKNLSLGDKASVETGLNKLTGALKQNNEFRTQLVQQLQDVGEKDLTGQIAGSALNPKLPRGLTGKLIEGGAAYQAGIAGLLHPGTLAVLATTSPRLVGEFVRALGLGNKAVQTVFDAIKNTKTAQFAKTAAVPSLKTLNQVGKINRQSVSQ